MGFATPFLIYRKQKVTSLIISLARKIKKEVTMLNSIIKELNLKEEDIEFPIETISSDNSEDYVIVLKKVTHVCPNCGSLVDKVKDYTMRKIKHKIFEKRNTIIYYKSRRFICPNCNKTFIERHTFGNQKRQLSASIIDSILKELKPYNSTFSSVARRFNVSATTVINVFDKHVQVERKTLTEILCWDEFYFNRHSKSKYAFTIMDFEKKIILDIVESRREETLTNYFSKIPKEERMIVKYIIIDMYKTYKELAHIFFKNATICIDPFHVTKKVNDSLNAQRKYVMRKYSSDKESKEYRLLKHSYKVLLKDGNELEIEKRKYSKILGYSLTEKAMLERLLEIDENLKLAYQLKERFLEFNASDEALFTTREDKESELNILIRSMNLSNIRSMQDCAKTLKNWKKEILNSFIWINGRRLSNGPIEGKNAYIKKIISNANGLNNFERARNKFMYSQNLYERYSMVEHKHQIKRKGSPRGPYKNEK